MTPYERALLLACAVVVANHCEGRGMTEVAETLNRLIDKVTIEGKVDQ